MNSLTQPRAKLCRVLGLLVLLFLGAASPFPGNSFAAPPYRIGAAKAEITPRFPVRLSGYGNRRAESEGIAQSLWAKALAITDSANQTALLVTVDNCGVPITMTDEVGRRLKKSFGLARERLAICSTHTHTGPCLSGVIPNLFSEAIPEEHQKSIDRYTRELTDQIEQACQSALSNRAPGFLSWAQGSADFAQNRRTQGGPVDHDLPVLRATDAEGRIRAIVANYACHCTTLFGDFNQVHGDWAGCAQQSIEEAFPGAIALMAIGCGADANPQPRGQLEHAEEQGRAIAREVQRLLAGKTTSLVEPLECRSKQIDLPYGPLPTREQWEARARQPGIVGYHAKVNLARLDRGESLPTHLPYGIQTWNFGGQLALIFLPGEVVVDYSLRLKKELKAGRIWINAYANDVPCYIPSRRILQEGGYEAEGSLWYYDRPARLSPDVEEMIIRATHALLPNEFRAQTAP